jgi:hypothetical protein
MRRVARGPVVLFTRDPRVVHWWWLHHYFPATARLEASRETSLGQLARMLGGRLEVIPVPIPADCTDGFNAAYWRRPHAYLDPHLARKHHTRHVAVCRSLCKVDGHRSVLAPVRRILVRRFVAAEQPNVPCPERDLLTGWMALAAE